MHATRKPAGDGTRTTGTSGAAESTTAATTSNATAASAAVGGPSTTSTTSTTSAASTVASRAPSKARSARPAAKHDPTPARTTRAKVDQAATAHTPASCLKFAGLGHIRRLSRDRWQGTTGDNSPRDLNASVFVGGPLASVAAADRAAQRARLVEIAYPGGRYVVIASKPSYLSATVSLAAACLSANGSYGF